MNIRIFAVSAVIALCLLHPLSTSAASPPKIPGKTYFQTKDGCGFLVDDSTLASANEQNRKFLTENAGKYWIGNCLHGLIDGVGYLYDPSPVQQWNEFLDKVYVLGEDAFLGAMLNKATYAINLPNEGNVVFFANPGTIEYQISDMSDKGGWFKSAKFPVAWNAGMRSAPVFNLNDGSKGNDIKFQFSGALPANESYASTLSGMSFEATSKKCNDVFLNIKVKGCSPPGKVFDVYGVLIDGLAGSEPGAAESRFILCPDPKTPVGCEKLWESSVGKYIDAMLAHARLVAEKVTEQNAQLAEKRKSATDALPKAWKSYWATNAIKRDAIDAALSCREISDYGPISLEDAEYIQNKYSSPPCNTAVVAQAVLDRTSKFIRLEKESVGRRAEQVANLEQYNRDRAQSRNQAWAGFFNSMNAVIEIQMQVQQQRIDNANAKVAAMQQQQQSAPVYQSYSQPSSSSAGQQSYAADKVKITPIHKPELDAKSCVKLVELAGSDSSLSGGSRVFSNQCGQTVEIFWCTLEECERGSGNTWSLGAGRSWPAPKIEVRYGACLGANGGGMVKNSAGKYDGGGYACTGP